MGKFLTVRNLVFLVGALGAVSEAIAMAQQADIQVTPAHLIAAACVALCGFAAKWPTDVSKAEHKESVARARRESIAPPSTEAARADVLAELRAEAAKTLFGGDKS